MAQSDFLLETVDITKTYSGRTVVDHIRFGVGKAEIVGLLGRNGAGKTTSFRITIGMITPDSGQVLLHGKDISTLPMYKRAQLGMGYLSQEPSIFTRLTVEENLLAILETTPLRRRERKVRCLELLDQFGLTKTRKQEARTLSGGERRKLEIARALITSPTIILLDEPFSGVDPITVESLQQEILRLREDRRISILLTDHNVRDTLRVTDRSYIVHEGKVFREGSPTALINDKSVREVYLGHTFNDEIGAAADNG